jgi:hypothetical protein
MSPVPRRPTPPPNPQMAALELLCRVLMTDEEWLLALAKRLADEPAEDER